DVIWTFDTLKAKGPPMYASYYADVLKAEKTGERKVLFTFRNTENHELPLILGQLPALPSKWWATRDFEKASLEVALSSGAYKVDGFDVGRSITYRRLPDWWAKDLWMNRGRNNFETLRYEYYRDAEVTFEAFKGGETDVRRENSGRKWMTRYDIPAVKDGRIKRDELPNEMPQPMQGFVFNLRRELFKDRRVREAIGLMYDFEWQNKNLSYGFFTRSRSFFGNSELEAKGLPSPEELKILEPLRGKIPDEVFTKEYNPPKYDGSGNIRDGLREALKLLKEAGWSVKNEKLVNDKSGQPLEFEILLSDPQMERIVLPFAKNLERMGVTARVRTVDNAQYEKRMETFDYDMAVEVFGQSLSPGNEQRDYWGSKAAEEEGSRNLLGIKSPVIDELIEELIKSPDRASLVAHTHALDRVLQYGYYMIPNFHVAAFRVAYWDKFRRPQVSPKYGIGIDGWWVDPKAEQTIEAKKGEVNKGEAKQ